MAYGLRWRRDSYSVNSPMSRGTDVGATFDVEEVHECSCRRYKRTKTSIKSRKKVMPASRYRLGLNPIAHQVQLRAGDTRRSKPSRRREVPLHRHALRGEAGEQRCFGRFNRRYLAAMTRQNRDRARDPYERTNTRGEMSFGVLQPRHPALELTLDRENRLAHDRIDRQYLRRLLP